MITASHNPDWGLPPINAKTENWPGWRGYVVMDPPRHKYSRWLELKRNCMENSTTGKGHASPIIWGDRVFVVTIKIERRALLSIDRKTGRVVWQRDILKSAFERIHRLNSRASSTPVTDGNSRYLSFLQVMRCGLPPLPWTENSDGNIALVNFEQAWLLLQPHSLER